MQLLNDVVNFRLGQTIDDVRGNAVILSGIAQPSPHIEAVCVKFIFISSVVGKNQEGGGLADDL